MKKKNFNWPESNRSKIVPSAQVVFADQDTPSMLVVSDHVWHISCTLTYKTMLTIFNQALSIQMLVLYILSYRILSSNVPAADIKLTGLKCLDFSLPAYLIRGTTLTFLQSFGISPVIDHSQGSCNVFSSFPRCPWVYLFRPGRFNYLCTP